MSLNLIGNPILHERAHSTADLILFILSVSSILKSSISTGLPALTDLDKRFPKKLSSPALRPRQGDLISTLSLVTISPFWKLLRK